MDDQTHNSPPSSRKSSVLGKLDRPETPNRGSPYLTRSRKSSTLTEENIAMHNDTPTSIGAPTRRITRRMSQSNENPVVLTPMPQVAKRTRRSPSVASGDDLVSTPKKKFSVAQENVVIEEDETVEENKLESTGAGTNGSKIENEGDKENINTIVNGNALDETLQHKSPDTSDSNKTGPVVEQPMEPTILTETAPADSTELAVSTSNSVAIPDEVSTRITESVNADVSVTQSSIPPSTSESSDQNVTVNSQTAVAINEQSESDSPKLSESMLDIVRKFTSEMNTTEENLESTSASPNLNDISIVEINDTVCEMKTPNKLAEISSTDTIAVPETPNASIIVIPDTPIQIHKSLTPETPNMFSSTGDPETPILNPSTVQSLQQADSPKTPVQAKTSVTNDVIGRVTRLSTLKTPKVLPSVVEAVQQVDSPKTPVQQKNSVTLDVTPATPLMIPKTVPVTQQSDSVIHSKTPIQTNAVTTPVAIRETANTVVDVKPSTPNSALNVTESEEELLLRTPPTPSRPASERKSKVEVTEDVPSVDKTPNTPKVEVDPAETAPLQNGNVDENTESKWGSSVHRKSDGKPIDQFGVTKLSAETATSKVKPNKKDTSTVNIADTSDEESCDDSDNESGSRNMFLDDEAMESNGEASMDEEERKYMEENEIPEDGISLGSESDEAMSEEEESDDSFIVSDSSVQLLDGTGDDIGNESVKRDTSKRGNKIVDTSDEECKEEPKKSSNKRRPDSSLNRTAKYYRVDDDDEEEEENDTQNNVNKSGDEDELANLDVEPKKTRSSKRLSESTSLSKKDTKRLSLHPNMKLSSLESNDCKTDVNKNDSLEADDNSEEDVTQELANLDEGPKRITRSKRQSESFVSSKKDNKRMSLHPNTKLSSVELIQKENELSVNLNQDEKQSTGEGAPTTVEESSKATVEEELANLDNEPKKSKNKKRLSEMNSVSKKEMKRLSLHPNTKLSSLESNEDEQEQNREQQQQSKADENDSNGATIVLEDGKDIAEELANLDDEPKMIGKSKRLSDAMPTSKNDTKRLSLHPNAKLNRSGFDFKVFASTVITAEKNDVEIVASAVPNTAANDQSAPDAGQQKMEVERSVEEIQAKCDELLQQANETRRLEKLNKQPMQEDKYQRLKEKKAAKLKEKKEKEAREKEREAQAEAQRQLKRDKKSKIAQITEQEKRKAIQKAIDFSETIKARKAQHSIVVSSESTEEERIPSPVKTKKRKPKRLQILNEEPNQTKKKRRVVDTEQLPAKPEGFKTSSIPVKSRGNKIKQKPGKDTDEGETSAGSFTVEPMPTSSASPFVVTTLQYNPAIKFSSFKDKAISNSNVQRVSSAELLNRKKKQKKMQKN